MASVEVLITQVQERFRSKANCSIQHNQLTLEIDVKDLLDSCNILKNDEEFKFEQLIDLCGVDYLHYGMQEWTTTEATGTGFSRGVMQPELITTKYNQYRFAVVYNLLSVTHNHRIRVRVLLNDDPPRIPTVLDIWQSANWYEREAFDLYGILFDGHPDLRRILTDYGFIGHPFRKDFPLSGHVEVRYDASCNRVIYEPVDITPRTLTPKVIR